MRPSARIAVQRRDWLTSTSRLSVHQPSRPTQRPGSRQTEQPRQAHFGPGVQRRYRDDPTRGIEVGDGEHRVRAAVQSQREGLSGDDRDRDGAALRAIVRAQRCRDPCQGVAAGRDNTGVVEGRAVVAPAERQRPVCGNVAGDTS